MMIRSLIVIGVVFGAYFSAVAQDGPIKRNYAFQKGNVVSSSTGTLNGDLYLSQEKDQFVVGVFTGSTSNLRSEVVRSEGVVEVNVSEVNGKIRVGDLLSTSENGLAVKCVESGMTIGVALSEPRNGKVSVRMNIEYKTL